MFHVEHTRAFREIPRFHPEIRDANTRISPHVNGGVKMYQLWRCENVPPAVM